MNTENIEIGLYPQPVFRQKVLFDAVEIAYTDTGDLNAPVILFIHGLGHALIAWNKNIAPLAQKYRCIAIDLPGNGLSSKDINYPYSMEFFAEAVKDFIIQKGLTQVFLCGHSMGGQVALTLAQTSLPGVKGVVLCAPAGIEQFNAVERNLYKGTMLFVDLLSTEENSLRKAINNSFYIMPESAPLLIQQLVSIMQLQSRAHYRVMMEKCIVGMLEEPVYDHLHNIEVPVHILFGEKDGLIPNKIIHPISLKQMLDQAMPKLVKGSYNLIPKCGHFLQWEKPEDVNFYIDSFVKETLA
ncbi:MAG: hypothetical protein BGO31_05680 [Bacteroidetes bacterium 43-16]|nr:MAG: hypothetical protein BGO31_05680 [Bacteroidetes bacterium 43-16]